MTGNNIYPSIKNKHINTVVSVWRYTTVRAERQCVSGGSLGHRSRRCRGTALTLGCGSVAGAQTCACDGGVVVLSQHEGTLSLQLQQRHSQRSPSYHKGDTTLGRECA